MSVTIDNVTVYDNGGETFDRYTVVIGDDFYAMSDHQGPQGFNQYCGSIEDGYKEGEHLGERLTEIPDTIKSAITNRLESYKE